MGVYTIKINERTAQGKSLLALLNSMSSVKFCYNADRKVVSPTGIDESEAKRIMSASSKYIAEKYKNIL